MSQFEIRPVRPEDASRLAEIHMLSWKFAYSSFLSREIIDNQNKKRPKIWEKITAENVDSSYCALVNNVIIGLIGICPARDQDLINACFELQGLYFDPQYIGKGYGKASMNWVFEEARRRGYKRICVWVFEKNSRAIGFYEKCGFRLDDSAPNESMHGERVVRYMCDL